jgi:hypothetical protein
MILLSFLEQRNVVRLTIHWKDNFSAHTNVMSTLMTYQRSSSRTLLCTGWWRGLEYQFGRKCTDPYRWRCCHLRGSPTSCYCRSVPAWCSPVRVKCSCQRSNTAPRVPQNTSGALQRNLFCHNTQYCSETLFSTYKTVHESGICSSLYNVS